MKTIIASASLTFALIAAIACQPSEQTSTTPSEPATQTPVASTEKAMCAACNTEYPKADLVSHDGQTMCKACVEAHHH